MALLKTFGVWFLLGVGLLFSGFFAVEAIREYRSSSQSDDFILLVSMFTVAGGIFVGLTAVALRRLAEPPLTSAVLGGQPLMEHAARLGVSLKHVHDSNGNLLEPELQRRVLDAEKSLRERRGYVLAVGAAVVSALSAVAAWLVHLK
ncbi:MAG: hypothetical protein M1283_02615 [Gammaproteobacteria bacterium]|nr:hypothetical protein [Gammaproteobacteria bacterium]